MRTIKFRAWDKTYKRMNYKVQVGNTDYADQNYTCNSIWVDYGDTKSIGWMNADDKCIDLMQFTGLQDVNGKEAYDGDIFNDLDNVSYVIKQDNLMTWAERVDGSPTWYRDFDKEVFARDMIIVGNIYETPELLKENESDKSNRIKKN